MSRGAGRGNVIIDNAVTVGNFPVTQPISGAITVSNFPTTQTIYGSVTANLPVGSAVKMVDDTGAAWGWRHADNQARVINKPYLYATAEGDITGHTGVNKPGYHGAISTSMVDLWGITSPAVYVPPASAMQMSVKSSDNTQDKAGGTGALKVEIHYLNNLYVEATEEITLNGTTWVDTAATNILRINGFHVTSCGTDGYPTGNITISDKATRSIVYGFITAGYNRAFNSFYTVPAGKVLYITAWQCGVSSSSAKYGDLILKATTMEGVKTNFWFGLDRCLIQDSTVLIPYTYPFRIPATADVKISVKGSGTIAVVSHYEGWIE